MPGETLNLDMKGILAVAAATLFLLPVPARSEVPLDWEACRRMAMAQNPDFIAAKKAEEAACANLGGSIAGLLPSASLSDSWSDGPSQKDATRWRASLSAQVNIFNANDWIAIMRDGASLRIAKASFRSTSAQVRQSLRGAFADMVYATEQARISEEIATLREHNARLVTLRYDSGRELLGGKLRVDAQLKEARANASAAKRNLMTSRAALARLLGRADTPEWPSVTGELSFDPSPGEFPAAAPVENLPSVVTARARVAQSRASLNTVRARLLPTASASWSRSRVGPDYYPDDGPLSWSAGVGISLPLFSSGVLDLPFAWLAASASLEQSEQNARMAELQAATGLRSAWSNYAGATETVEVQEAYLAASEQRNRESDIRYESGFMSFENWEQIVTDFVNYKRSALRASRDAVAAEAAWMSALGRGLEE